PINTISNKEYMALVIVSAGWVYFVWANLVFAHTIDIQKIHFARQQVGDNTVVYLRPITQRNYFSECLYCPMVARYG
ncbi:MAG: hypothetical protein WCR46_12070, partial [Deltaproteobacteria bacterium]